MRSEFSILARGEVPPPGGVAEDDRLRASDVGKLLRRARRRVVGAARVEDRVTFHRLAAAHLGVDPSALDVVQESWPSYDHVNVQAGLDSWLAEQDVEHRLHGVVNFRHRDFGLAELVGRAFEMHMPVPGNVARLNLASGPDGQSRPCVVCAVYLVTWEGRAAVLLLRMGDPESGRASTSLEVLAAEREVAERVAAEVRDRAVTENVYRGQVVSFEQDMFGPRGGVLSFHRRPTMTAEDLILPAGTREAITRQVVGVARHRSRLRDAGQHLKRGLLLYGPPGVGKTHTVRYLTAVLTGTTIVELSGSSLQLIGAACSVARTLQPAMIVIEDVDLIAEERGMHPGQHPLLFQLLNEMDGLAEDADVVFLLTTNRADVLEPALAQRPGRVDQAVELALPDRQARERLFELYQGALEVDTSRLAEVLDRTEGVTASFLKELLRRAAVLAADADGTDEGTLAVSADQLLAALEELLSTRNAMTRALLGAGVAQDRAPAAVPEEYDAGPRPGRR
jgi:hypothetical protein